MPTTVNLQYVESDPGLQNQGPDQWNTGYLLLTLSADNAGEAWQFSLETFTFF